MRDFDRIPKYIKAAAADPEQNPHRLTAKQISDRIYNRKWSLEKALSLPILTKTEAARRGAKKSNWSNWEPGKFSARDKELRGHIK
jgi:hypothetical protein